MSYLLAQSNCNYKSDRRLVTNLRQELKSDRLLDPKLGRKLKAKYFPHGATDISSDPLCSWRLGTTRDEHAECSVES